MNTELERLKTEYPNLCWIDGCIYKSKNHVNPLYNEVESLDLLFDYYTGYDIVEKGFMGNPEEESIREATPLEYITANFKDMEDAFNSIRP